MIFARLGFRVLERHGHEGHGGGVAVLEALEDGAAEGVLGLVRDATDFFSVALDDEMGDATLEIGLGLPGKLGSGDTKAGAGGGVVSGTAVSLT